MTPENDGKVADGEADHGHGPETDDAPQHLALVLGALLPEVDKNHPEAVEGVEHDGGNEAKLTEAHNGVLVRSDDHVVGLGRHAHQRGIQNMDQKEEEDHHASNSMGHPGPLAFAAAVKRACW